MIRLNVAPLTDILSDSILVESKTARETQLAQIESEQATAITTTQARLEYPVSDRAVSLGYRPSNRQLQQIGKQASRLYQERHGTKPVQREQFVGGATR